MPTAFRKFVLFGCSVRKDSEDILPIPLLTVHLRTMKVIYIRPMITIQQLYRVAQKWHNFCTP